VALIFGGLVLVIRAGDPRTQTETPPV